MNAHGIKAIDVKRSVLEEYNHDLQSALAETVWAKDGRSWYKTETGLITNNWPYSTLYYTWLLRSANFNDFEHLSSMLCKKED